MNATLRRPRRTTPGKTVTVGGRKVKIDRPKQRYCNGCKRRLGDMTLAEIKVPTRDLPDVRSECPNCTPNPPGLSWRMDLPWPVPPLSLNDRDSQWERARKVREVREFAGTLARAMGIPPLAAMRLELHWVPGKPTRRDPRNLEATVKAAEDGIVDAGVVPDDGQWFSPAVVPVIHAVNAQAPCVYLLIREVAPGKVPE